MVANYTLDKIFNNFFHGYDSQSDCLDPFYEVVHADQDVTVATGHGKQQPHNNGYDLLKLTHRLDRFEWFSNLLLWCLGFGAFQTALVVHVGVRFH